MEPLEVTATYCCCRRRREIAFLLERESAINVSEKKIFKRRKNLKSYIILLTKYVAFTLQIAFFFSVVYSKIRSSESNLSSQLATVGRGCQ